MDQEQYEAERINNNYKKTIYKKNNYKKINHYNNFSNYQSTKHFYTCNINLKTKLRRRTSRKYCEGGFVERIDLYIFPELDIVVSGAVESGSSRQVEVFRTDFQGWGEGADCCMSQACELPDLPDQRFYHSINQFQYGNLIICGGYQTTDNCISLINGSWIKTHSLLFDRLDHSSWTTDEGVILIGGENSPTTTEIVTESGRVEQGFQLKHPVRYVLKKTVI